MKNLEFRGRNGAKKRKIKIPDPFVGKYAPEVDYISFDDEDWDVDSVESESINESLVDSMEPESKSSEDEEPQQFYEA